MSIQKEDYDIFNLITQAQISIQWIQESSVNVNENDSIGIKLSKFLSENEMLPPFNQGVLLMASYMYFVLPKESIFDNLSGTNIDTSMFKIIRREKINYPVIKSIRNAIAHGNVSVNTNNEGFIFKDKLPNANSYHFEAEVQFAKFGEFISSYYFTLKDYYFKK